MTNSEKLRALADWFDQHDAKQKNDFDKISKQVQSDLRAMANEFERLQLSGIVRPEGERPSDEEIIHALDLAQCEIKAMYSKTGYITSTALAVVNKVHKSLKAAAQGGEPLPAEGVAQSRRVVEYCKCGQYMMTAHAPCPCERTD